MSMNDPISDMLTRIRNANAIRIITVEMPSSTIKVGIAEVLKREGFIEDFRVEESSPQNLLKVYMKYGPRRERVIRSVERISKCGSRTYSAIEDLKPVLKGQGIYVLTTNKGVLSDREAKKLRVGGEIICRVW